MKLLVMAETPDEAERLSVLVQRTQLCGASHPLCYGDPALTDAESFLCDTALLSVDEAGAAANIAHRLKQANPRCNLIFWDRDGRHGAELWAFRPSGYLTGELTTARLQTELTDLRYPLPPRQPPLLSVRCMGNFDVFLPDGQMLYFSRSKAKEAFAYLIHRHGSACTVREIASILFEDRAYDSRQRQYMQKILSSMMKSLRDAGAEEVVIKHFNSIAIDVSRVDCDSYRLCRLDEESARMCQNEYMRAYSWAETVPAFHLWMKGFVK